MRALLQKLGLPLPPAPSANQLALKQLIADTAPLRVILGAGPTHFPGWIATEMDTLNLLRLRDWQILFGSRRIDSLLAEHVWEHLAPADAEPANRNCFRFLKPGGRFRLAVPDALHPDPAYREWVRPGGCGAGADDHKVFYDYNLLSASLRKAGFRVQLLEYWDEHGKFNFTDWSSGDGHIARSRRYDSRNRDGSLAYTSLIADAFRP